MTDSFSDMDRITAMMLTWLLQQMEPLPVPEDIDMVNGGYILVFTKPGPWRSCWGLELATTPGAVGVQKMNRMMIEIARNCVPQATNDVNAHYARIQSELSLTRTRAETYTDIGLLCERMPDLGKVLEGGMLSFDHLRMLARSTDGIRHEDISAAEGALIGVLSPRRSGQHVPGPRTLFKKIMKALHEVDALARPIDHTCPEGKTSSCAEMIPVGVGGADEAEASGVTCPEGIDDRDSGTLTQRVSVDTYDPLATVITATLPPAEADEFITVLDAVCRKLDCRRADGLMHLVRGTADVSVTLNVYRELGSDIVATDGGHWLDAMASEKFMERVTHLRIPGHDVTETYTPTEQIAAFTRGTYSACTFPGCDVPSTACDLDHVHRYNVDDPDTGGPTDTRNLHPLCRRHHQIKTLGWTNPTRAPDGAVMWSSVHDGHTYVTEPTGPLAGYARTTFSEQASRRFTTVREHNRRRLAADAERKEALRVARLSEDDPVPF